MEQVKVYLYREKDGSYSCYDDGSTINYGLIGEGETAEDAIAEWEALYGAMKQSYARVNMPFVEAEFTYVYDIPSLIAYYGSLLSYKGLAKITGIRAAQLAQYAAGSRTPTPPTIAKIQEGMHLFAKELLELKLT